MRHFGVPFWCSAPFVRLLIPLTAGIVLEQYSSFSLYPICIAIIVLFSLTLIFQCIPNAKKYHWRWINGLSFNGIMVCIGSLLLYFQNITHHPKWIGYYAEKTDEILVTLQEPLTARTGSYKTTAKAEAVFVNGERVMVKGSLLLYFRKDSMYSSVKYGSQLLIYKKLQPITHTGNPGGFDYQEYCAFQGIHYQVYLQPGDYSITGITYTNTFTQFLIDTRSHVLNIFRKWVPGSIEAGVAEALLIGYRDDLDKDLVTAYSNSGVVHIIAISGLHLGMIYGLMLAMLTPFRKQTWIRWVKPVLILLVLWGFSLLAGAVASILRSVVMFSFIVIGESLGRKTNIYNTLAASAFCLLVYNPYFFRDIGFQLSYTAVLGIVLFMKPIYRCLYFPNKLLSHIWQLNAITLSAQILTLPQILLYFHQFPNLFLFTNFIAVPLSGFILYGELLLLVVCKIQLLNEYTGKSISFLIREMNGLIERTSRLPFAVTDHINTGLAQTVLLYFVIGFLAWWVLQKKTKGLLAGAFFLLCWVCLQSIKNIQQKEQQKLIVYHIPKHTAIDIIDGHRYVFWGDDTLQGKNTLNAFYLQPSRVQNGIRETGTLANINIHGPLITGMHKSVLIIDSSFHVPDTRQKIPVDIILLSGNPGIYLSQLAAVFNCEQYVFDSSNPLWKIRYWKKDAGSLHLRHHAISEQGAFEMDL